MALSALHLYSENRSRSELFDRACYLQGVAIQLVQPVIANLRQEDSLAALMFSGHTTSFGLAEYMLNPHHDDTDPIDKIVECFQLSRGIKLVVSPFWPYLSQTWLNKLFSSESNNEDRIRATLASIFPTYSMVRSLAFGQEDADRRKCCLETIEDIFTFIEASSRHPQDYPTPSHLIDRWAVKIPVVFKDMLVERKPIALIILAYWAVLTSINPRSWHLRGLAEVLIARIEDILGEEWTEFLRWPREKIIENTLAAQDPSVRTPRFGDQKVDSRLRSIPLSRELSFQQTITGVPISRPPPYNVANGQGSAQGSTSNHPSPYNTGSNVHSPFSQDPPTG